MARRLLLRRRVETLFQSVGPLAEAMTFHRQRQTVLAGNLANLDTPGYQPRDLDRRDGATATGEIRRDGATAPGEIG